MENILTIGVQVSTILTSITVFVMILQLRSDTKDQDLQYLFYLHEYLSNSEFTGARHLVRTELFSKPYDQWVSSDKIAANQVCASYDQAGLLISEGVLNKKTVSLFIKSSWGESICDQFEILRPYLDDQLTPHTTGRRFFRHFDTLYRQACQLHRI